LCTPVVKKGMQSGQVATKRERMATGRDVALRQLLRWKVRYSTDGAAVRSRAYVDGLYEQCRERFGVGRKSGARRMRGRAAGAADLLWTVRDLRKGID
jgi:hypothetical protein